MVLKQKRDIHAQDSTRTHEEIHQTEIPNKNPHNKAKEQTIAMTSTAQSHAAASRTSPAAAAIVK